MVMVSILFIYRICLLVIVEFKDFPFGFLTNKFLLFVEYLKTYKSIYQISLRVYLSHVLIK